MPQRRPREHPDHPGYYWIPENDRIIINKEGQCISLLTHEPLKGSLTTNGYWRVSSRINGKKHDYKIHRLLAMTFIPRPPALAEVPFTELQVKHLDDDKTNNALTNLEWSLPFESVERVQEQEKPPRFQPVCSRNIQTSEERHFPSVMACAMHFDIDPRKLARHVQSRHAGRISKDWHVFKKADGTPWPELTEFEYVESRWDFNGLFLGLNLNNGQIVLFTNLQEACQVLKLDYYGLRIHRWRAGKETPYNGWVFEYKDSIRDISFSALQKRIIDSLGKGAYRVTHTATGKCDTYPTLLSVSRVLDTTEQDLKDAIRRHKGVFGEYLIEQKQ